MGGVVVPVTVEFTTDEVEHLPHRAVFESAALISQVAETVAGVLERVDH